MGSPPPTGSKKEVLKLRSVSNIVIAPAKTGRDSNNKTVVTKIDQTNKGVLFNVMPSIRMFMIVVIKLMAPRIEEAPAKCRLKMVKSTLGLVWKVLVDRGGYTVQPVPAPLPAKALVRRSVNDGGNNQNLILFIRGKAMSGAPIINGTSQLPNPPIIIGITIKKIIMNA